MAANDLDALELRWRLVMSAAEVSGGVTKLAAAIESERTLIFRWLNGSEAVPDAIFLRLVEILLDAIDARRGPE